MYIISFLKEELISNRKVNMSEMSKINSLRIKRYSNFVCRVNRLKSITNVSEGTNSRDITDQHYI